MKNETPMYLVPGWLTDEQAAKATKAATRAIALGRENSIADFIIRTIGTPIQPCADVETVGWGREDSFGYLKVPGCHAVSIRKEWEGGVPLVRRTDMEAQIAKVAAEKDAEIVRYRKALTDLSENITCGCMPCMGNCWDKDSLRDEISERAEIARTALKEGSGA